MPGGGTSLGHPGDREKPLVKGTLCEDVSGETLGGLAEESGLDTEAGQSHGNEKEGISCLRKVWPC